MSVHCVNREDPNRAILTLLRICVWITPMSRKLACNRPRGGTCPKTNWDMKFTWHRPVSTDIRLPSWNWRNGLCESHRSTFWKLTSLKRILLIIIYRFKMKQVISSCIKWCSYKSLCHWYFNKGAVH